jgi:TolB-like protein
LLAAIVLVAGAIASYGLLGPRIETADIQKMAFPLPEKPSIAIMPFDNLSGDSGKDILIEGLVEEVITKLSGVPGLFVIARNSTFSYKGRPWTVQQVAEELGVRFVLEGSVRVDGDNSRFSVHLIDAVGGNQIWAESFDREIKDLLALQSEVAGQIVSELDVNLVPDDRARLQRQTTNNPEAYELFLRGQAAPANTLENNLAKIKLYDEAVSLDPEFSAALAASSIRHSMSGRLGWEDPEAAYGKGEELANKAIAADNAFSGAYLALSTVHRFRREFEQSLALVEKAIALARNNAEAVMYKGRMLRLLRGRAGEAVPLVRHQMIWNL